MQFLLFALLVSVAFCQTTRGIPGGMVEQDPTKYTETSWKAFKALNSGNEAGPFWVPIKVIRASSQVIAGTRTLLDVLVGQSDCDKGTDKTNESCPITGGKRALFEVEVIEQHWKKLLTFSAKKIRDVKEGEEL